MGPQISIYDSNNAQLFTTWDLNNIQSQQATDILTVYVWNNRVGEDPTKVSDLKNAYVTVVDENGETANGEVAKNKWVQVNIPNIDKDETTFFPIGGSTTRGIRGGGNLTENVLKPAIQTDSDKELADRECVCKLNFVIIPPPNSTPGEKRFKIRIGGWFS